MANCRWNPTTNGSVHFGHVYSLLVNERFAHQSGGKFHIRFDDTSQAIVIEMKNHERVDKIIENQRNDIEWLGIEVDSWSKQSNILEYVHKEMSKHGLGNLVDVY